MVASAYLAIDLGAESGRAIVGVLDEGKLALHELHRFDNPPRRLPTGLHWDLTGLWANVLEGTRKACAWTRARGVRLASVGVDTWGVDYALIGRSGELLGLPHCYRDPRNVPAFEKTLATIGREALYEATGVQLMALNTLYQLVAQHDAEPGMLAQADKLLLMPDLMHYFFTGRPVVEASIASTSQMIDPRTGAWATDVLERLGLPTQMLGQIVPAATNLGPLLPEIAADVGADDRLRVIVPAAHDTASAVAAVPADPSTDWCYISSGTWAPLGAEVDQPCITAEGRDALFANEGGIGGTIRFLRNITGMWLVEECRRELESRGIESGYDHLIASATSARRFRTLVDPEHAPFGSPGDMPEKIAAFARNTNQPEPEDSGQLVRCCLESLALSYRRTLNQLEQVLGRSFDVLHIVGGGGKNRLLNQMAADALGRRVVVGPYEATATGNVLVQAVGAGDVADRSELRCIVADSVALETNDPQRTRDWDDAYGRFMELARR